MADQYPEGISARHASAGANRHASWWRLAPLALVVVAALSGWLGGAPASTRRVTSAAATFAVTTPDRLRNGMLFETRISAVAKRGIGDAVIAIPAEMWRDVTINGVVPEPVDEEFAGGEFRLHFGPLGAGKTLGLKIDGQLNPPRFSTTSGRLRLLDGEAELAALPLSLKVIP
jgi:hypothetical protein